MCTGDSQPRELGPRGGGSPVTPPGKPTVLTGGVASDVEIVMDANGREIVIKRALPKLKVAKDWRADPARSGVEVEGLLTLRDLLGPGTAPEVLWIDADNHRFAMQRIDSRLQNWRSRLEGGEVDLQTAGRAGELLGQLHARSAERPGLAQRFANRTFFEQLRIEPFFLRCAQRNPPLAPAIGAVVATLRLPGTALVHGDYSPKNLLVAGPDVVILDCEVAHWGDPRFDVAFCLAHLLLDGWRSGTSTRAFRDAALSFAHAYRLQGSQPCGDVMLVRMLGCLVLARLEGDSPVDYLDDLDVPAVKAVAVRLIDGHAEPLLPLISCLLR